MLSTQAITGPPTAPLPLGRRASSVEGGETVWRWGEGLGGVGEALHQGAAAVGAQGPPERRPEPRAEVRLSVGHSRPGYRSCQVRSVDTAGPARRASSPMR